MQKNKASAESDKAKTELESAINVIVKYGHLLSIQMILRVVKGFPFKVLISFSMFLFAIAAIPFSISEWLNVHSVKITGVEKTAFRDTLDNIFGEEWFVYPDFNPTAVGVKRLPRYKKVSKPIQQIEACDTIFRQGDIISIDCGGNVLLEHAWRSDDIPERQQGKLFEWKVLDANRESNTITIDKINRLLGDSSWVPNPNPEYSSFSIKGYLRNVLDVNFPITNVDNEKGHKFTIGDKVPPDQKVTVWFSGEIQKRVLK